MKVFACPSEVPFAEPDYANFDCDREEEREETHLADLAAWLRENGFAGEHTGDTIRLQIADGYARYMLADGPYPALVHLPYGDRYSSPLASRLRYDEVLNLIDREKRLSALLTAAGAA